MRKTTVLAAIAVLALPGFALAQSAATQGASSPATQAYMQAMQGMQQKMQGMTPTNDANKDFVMMMSPHHQAAVDMAEAYLKYGNDPTLKKMARDIVSSQKKEIAEMDAWKAKHGMKGE